MNSLSYQILFKISPYLNAARYSTSVITDCGSPEKAIFTFLPRPAPYPH